MLAELTSFVSNICIISITIWIVVKYFKLKKYLYNYMDIDNLINQIDSPEVVLTQDNKMKERLIHVVASGKSKEYLGRLYNTEEIDKLDEKEMTKLYSRYEAVLGGQITKILKQHMILAYTRGIELACPAVSQGRLAVCNSDKMFESLNNGPFIDLALTSLTCKMYHTYGHFLAPLEAILLTSNFVRPVNLQEQPQQEKEQHRCFEVSISQDRIS